MTEVRRADHEQAPLTSDRQLERTGRNALLPNENLLRILADRGEMTGQEFASHVPRRRGDYTDFFGAAALFQNGYIAKDETTTDGEQTTKGKLGHQTKDTAVTLCQLSLPLGNSFTINDCPRDSMHTFPVNVFITGSGLLKLEEIDLRAVAEQQKRRDYVVAAAIGIMAAIVSSLQEGP